MSGMAENFCDSCGRDIGKYEGALCGGCADDAYDREQDRYGDEAED